MRDHACDCGARVNLERDPAGPDWWIGRCACGTRHGVFDPEPQVEQADLPLDDPVEAAGGGTD